MLTSLEIENFKGIAARQRIDFAPLTLLFGANSAGKSTVLQSLLYLHELLERGNGDIDRTELGGGVLELGGFARLVHRHDLGRSIVLRAEFATPGGLERFGRDITDFPFPDLDDEVESAWLEVTISHRTTNTFRGPVVERAVLGVNREAEPLVWLEVGASLRDGEPLHARVNLGHPLLASEMRELPGATILESDGTKRPVTTKHAPAQVTDAWEQIAIPEAALQQDGDGRGDGAGGIGDGSGFGDGRSLPVFAIRRARLSALPAPAEPLRVLPAGDLEGDREAIASLRRKPPSLETDKEIERLESSIALRERAAREVRIFLEMVVLGTTSQLASFLREALYVGPLRTIPPRGYLYERAGRATSWADGLAAWDLLLADRTTLVDRTNAWLRRLGTGCVLAVQQFFDRGADAEALSDDHVDKTVRRLLLDTGAGALVLPSEVGAGISQVVPVIVAAVDERSGLALIEQPEIHVHPAVQVGLGDLFIEAATRERSRRNFIIETHSEHLVLRILRRIRETTEGSQASEPRPNFSSKALSVLYVEATLEGVRVSRLGVDDQGEFTDRWPKGFFAERMKELL